MNQKQIHLSDFSLGCLLRYLLQNCWMIVATVLIFAMSTSLVLSWTHTDLYRATVTYSVTSRRTSYTSTNNLNAAKEASATLAQMLESNVVLDTLRADAALLSDFDGTIQATHIENTNFITITVTDDSPEAAFTAIHSLTTIFPTFSSYLSDSVVQIVRNPAVSSSPINRVNVRDSAMKLGLLGGVAMTLLLCWHFAQRETIQTRSGARRLLDAHIIATVYRAAPRRFFRRKTHKPIQVFSPSTSFAYTEQINTICARLEQESAANGARVILVTGVGENEGKSTIAGNVASALAIMGKRVALLDCDLRNPSLNRFFGGKYAATMPLNKLLAQPLTKENLLECMLRHDKLGLYMLFPLVPDQRCTELLSGTTMDQLIRQLRIFDYVILDTPPMGYFAEAEALAEKADASLLVVRQDHSTAREINDAIDILRGSGASFLGCVLNDMTSSITEGYSRNAHRYGYGYGYGAYGHYGQDSRHDGRKSQGNSRQKGD